MILKEDTKQDDGKETNDDNDDNINKDPTWENADMTMALKLTTTTPTTIKPGDDDGDDVGDKHSSDSEDSEDSETDDD